MGSHYPLNYLSSLKKITVFPFRGTGIWMLLTKSKTQTWKPSLLYSLRYKDHKGTLSVLKKDLQQVLLLPLYDVLKKYDNKAEAK